MADLNANDIEAAEKIIAGTARSMGITVATDRYGQPHVGGSPSGRPASNHRR